MDHPVRMIQDQNQSLSWESGWDRKSGVDYGPWYFAMKSFAHFLKRTSRLNGHEKCTLLSAHFGRTPICSLVLLNHCILEDNMVWYNPVFVL